jgi:hypothetical protein
LIRRDGLSKPIVINNARRKKQSGRVWSYGSDDKRFLYDDEKNEDRYEQDSDEMWNANPDAESEEAESEEAESSKGTTKDDQ